MVTKRWYLIETTHPPQMNRNLLLLICLCFTSINAQNLPNRLFQNVVEVPCAVSSDTIDGFLEWSAYQTTDSSAWGPKDSICFDYGSVGNNRLELDLGQTNPALPIFIRSKLDTNNQVLLDSNTLYKVQFSFSSLPFSTPNLLLGTNCPDDLCSGVSIGIEIPDSAGTGKETRWYAGEFTDNGPYWNVEFCFSTERFPLGNHISNAWVRIGQDGNNSGIAIYNRSALYFEDFRFSTEQIRSISAPGNTAHLGWGNNLLMMYNDSTYPDANHISYVEATPSPNVATQQQLDIYIDFSANLNFQPFTQLRGAEVLGDTLRHTVNLINNGGTLCGYTFIDIVFENGNKYSHRAGKLDLIGPKSCMSFGNGGILSVEKNATLNYGSLGNGMLALRTGGVIEIGKNAELEIGGSLVLGEYRHETSPQKFEIILKRGSKLSFAEGAHLLNYLSKFPNETFLDVYLEGGVLDDRYLSEADKTLIRRHYASPMLEFEENLEIHGNPFSDVLEFSFISEEGIPLEANLVALDGRILQRKGLQSVAGHNLFSFETTDLAAGIYLLQIVTPNGKATRRVVHR